MRFLTIFIFSVFALQSAVKASDTLSEYDFVARVLEYHPFAKKAGLKLQYGAAAVRSARGAFDPYVYSKFKKKDFGGKTYYQLNDNGLKVPTWYGITAKAGYENNEGVYLNPENNVTSKGVTYAGIEISLLQGLVIDQRRAALKQAKTYLEITEQQQISQINDLLFSALEAYWEWSQFSNQLTFYKQATITAEDRYKAVRRRFELGDLSAMDTLEANIQWQNRLILFNSAFLKEAKARLYVSNFLWGENDQPLEIDTNLFPERNKALPIITEADVEVWLDSMSFSNPNLLIYDGLLEQLDVERKLKAEKLKPKLNLEYNLLQGDLGVDQFFSEHNYKFGFSFSIPIFLREARGNLQKTKLKIEETNYSRDQKELELKNKVRAMYQTFRVYNDQQSAYETYTGNYRQLRDAESVKFKTGESTLLKLNLREIKSLDAEVKLAELRSTRVQQFYQLQWIRGVLTTVN